MGLMIWVISSNILAETFKKTNFFLRGYFFENFFLRYLIWPHDPKKVPPSPKNRLKRPFLAIFYRKSRVWPPYTGSHIEFFFAKRSLGPEECAIKKLDSREVSGILFESIEVGSVGQKFEFFWFFFRNFKIFKEFNWKE